MGGFISRDVKKFEGNLNKNIRKYQEFQTTKQEIWISVVETLTMITEALDDVPKGVKVGGKLIKAVCFANDQAMMMMTIFIQGAFIT